MPENEDAVKVWKYCQDQYVMGFGGPVAINIGAIETGIKKVKPDFPDYTFDMVLDLAREVIQDIQENLEAQRDNNGPDHG